MSRLLSRAKGLVAPSGTRVRTIRGGAFHGLRMGVDFRHQTQLYVGLFERELYPWLEELGRGIRTAVDAGAGQGEHTLYFLAKTPASRVLAFEPSAAERSRLIANLSANHFSTDSRISISSKLLGSANGDGACTLDSLLPNLAEPLLIKIDVDGGEVDILQGAQRLLGLERVAWIIETHSSELEEECIRILAAAGFDTRIVSPRWWRFAVPELRPGAQNRWLIATKVCSNRDLVVEGCTRRMGHE